MGELDGRQWRYGIPARTKIGEGGIDDHVRGSEEHRDGVSRRNDGGGAVAEGQWLSYGGNSRNAPGHIDLDGRRVVGCECHHVGVAGDGDRVDRGGYSIPTVVSERRETGRDDDTGLVEEQRYRIGWWYDNSLTVDNVDVSGLHGNSRYSPEHG